MPEAARSADEDLPMRRTYALVVFCHIGVITALWWFGRFFTR
jgi:hypothetical protein